MKAEKYKSRLTPDRFGCQSLNKNTKIFCNNELIVFNSQTFKLDKDPFIVTNKIVKFPSDLNLCLFTACFNCLRTYEQRFAFCAGDIEQPFRPFIMVVRKHYLETVGMKFSEYKTQVIRDGYSYEDMHIYLRYLRAEGFLSSTVEKSYVWYKSKNKFKMEIKDGKKVREEAENGSYKKLVNWSFTKMFCVEEEFMKERNVLLFGSAVSSAKDKGKFSLDRKMGQHAIVNEIKKYQTCFKGSASRLKHTHGVAVRMEPNGELKYIDSGKNKLVQATFEHITSNITNIFCVAFFDILQIGPAIQVDLDKVKLLTEMVVDDISESDDDDNDEDNDKDDHDDEFSDNDL